jgi:hypothetical protein
MLEKFSKTLDSLNTEPLVATPKQGVGDGQARSITSRLIDPTQMRALRRELRTKSTEEIEALVSEQADHRESGIPIDMWLNRAGYAAQTRFNNIHNEVDPDISKAIDSGGISALIRQDLEPMLYELYVRSFPGFERLRREPANGLTHTYERITGYGDAKFMSELGTVTDDKSAYERKTTNIAILATRRGVSLKSKFAVTAGGMSFNTEQLELSGGMLAMANRMQYQIFNGTSSDSGGTSSNEIGAYDVNAFDGLRGILNTARAINVDPETSPTTNGNLRRAINQASIQIMQQGGSATIIWGHPFSKEQFDNQQDANVRYIDTLVNVTPGIMTNAVNTVFGALPIAVVPGTGIGKYTAATYSGYTVRDLFLLDEKTITLPYLGSEGPTVLDIPIGLSGQLTHLYIIFGMWGLAVKAEQFSNKVRVKTSAYDV